MTRGAGASLRLVEELSLSAHVVLGDVARAIVYAIEPPPDVDINEIVLRPTVQEL